MSLHFTGMPLADTAASIADPSKWIGFWSDALKIFGGASIAGQSAWIVAKHNNGAAEAKDWFLLRTRLLLKVSTAVDDYGKNLQSFSDLLMDWRGENKVVVLAEAEEIKKRLVESEKKINDHFLRLLGETKSKLLLDRFITASEGFCSVLTDTTAIDQKTRRNSAADAVEVASEQFYAELANAFERKNRLK